MKGRWALLVVPAVVFLLLAFGIPLWEIGQRAFTSFSEPGGGGFDNFTWFFGSHINVTILARTLETALLVTLATLLLAFPYAYVMTLVGPTWRGLMLAAILLSFWTSIVVRNFAWLSILRKDGVLNAALGLFGLGPLDIVGGVVAVTIGMTQILLPYMVLPLYATLRGIDRSLLQAAANLGANPARAFVRVYLPLASPGIIAGASLVFVLSLGFYITPALLGSPRQALISQFIVIQINTLLDWGHASAMGLTLLGLTLFLVVLTAFATRHTQRAYAHEAS
jgi:putative spermidine/putrescine transport system permease protein